IPRRLSSRLAPPEEARQGHFLSDGGGGCPSRNPRSLSTSGNGKRKTQKSDPRHVWRFSFYVLRFRTFSTRQGPGYLLEGARFEVIQPDLSQLGHRADD